MEHSNILIASKNKQLEDYSWPASRLGEMLENLARRSGLIARPFRLPQPPGAIISEEETISSWLDNAAGYLALEVEPISVYYSEVENLIISGWPAILKLPISDLSGQPLYLAIVKSNSRRVSILTPDLKTRHTTLKIVRDWLCYTAEAQLNEIVEQLIMDAGVQQERRSRARLAILRDQLGSYRIEAGWILRQPPGTKLNSLFKQAGIYKPVFIMLVMYFVQMLLTIATWIVIGRGIFQGHFDLGWLIAWGFLLLATIPVQIIVNDAQTELSMGAGTIFKQRLIYGTLQLEPEEIRHQGMGQFLGRVMESEAVEMLALSGGFMALLSIIDLILAFGILNRGAGGSLQAWMLVIWALIAVIMIYRYYQTSREWSNAYREMTNDLVENMVGHRTRLVQQNAENWHEDEDQTLDQYLKLSESMDQIGMQVNALVSRGWLLVGLTGTAIAYVTLTPTPQSLAISLAGILLASQGLAKLTSGAQSLVSLFNAWQQVGPLFQAASRPKELTALGFVPSSDLSQSIPQQSATNGTSKQPLLISKDLVFRYRPLGKPVIQDCSLQINSGDFILLEGPSGGGKSTLAAILTGLRTPESGSLLLWGFDRQILGPDEWRRRVVMAPQFQENYVFSETLAFNLLMGRRWPAQPEDLAEAEEICAELGLGELLQRMPSGFQQMLGESGWQLSHGERSRLFIARTLLQKTDLIILDESFGALDPENLYRSLQCVLNRAKTLLVIAHP